MTINDDPDFEYRAVIVRGELRAILTQDGWTCDDDLIETELRFRFDPSRGPAHSDTYRWAVESAAAWMQASIDTAPPLDAQPGVEY